MERDGTIHLFNDYLVTEEPLEIRIGATPVSVTMRTPGNDLELAVGFLYTEGIISSRSQIALVYAEADDSQNGANRVRVDLVSNCPLDPESMRRNFYAASSCGVCGKDSIDSVRSRRLRSLPVDWIIAPETLCLLPDRLRSAQKIFEKTGALHAVGLFSLDGQLLVLREDVGRHNAVDKIVGWALAGDRVPLHNTVLMVSGRAGFEVVQKAIAAGIPLLASVSAPSDLAVNLAREFGMTLLGFLRGRRFVIYSGAERLAQADSLSRFAARCLMRLFRSHGFTVAMDVPPMASPSQHSGMIFRLLSRAEQNQASVAE
jgi:FdhD protein